MIDWISGVGLYKSDDFPVAQASKSTARNADVNQVKFTNMYHSFLTNCPSQANSRWNLLTVKPVNLSDLATFVIAAKQRDLVWPPVNDKYHDTTRYYRYQ